MMMILKIFLTVWLLTYLVGCGVTDYIKAFTPSSKGVTTDVKLHKGKETNTYAGKQENVTADSVDQRTNNYGIGGFELSVILAILLGVISAFGYGCYSLGLARPQPKKYICNINRGKG